MEYKQVVTQPDAVRHVIILPNPRPYKPVVQARVPEGGAGWAFALAAVAVIGWAAAKRYRDNNSWKRAVSAA